MTPEDSNVEIRLRALESQVRRRRPIDVFGGIAIGVVLAVLLGNVRAASRSDGGASRQIVEASEFVLRDQDGVVRARLFAPEETHGAVGHGGPPTTETGRAVRLAMYDRTEKERLQLGVGIDGTPGVGLSSPTGASASMTANARASVDLFTGERHLVSLAALQSPAGSDATLTLRSAGDESLDLSVGPGVSGMLRMFKGGMSRLVLGEAKEIKTLAGMTPLPAGYALYVFDSTGKLLTHSPEAMRNEPQ